ncbi:hypothetical protein O181_016221 [Austropuccinia psidii MF-1]|uniref:Uncharacterized protein n=1 Tax=Austropuccinia psidii MF-1 TaxID=1389203 RepID=A0A9Q3C1A5_9BASI|nr:hypothetical protein [Austropuccinia psidii MF-1]
MEKSDPPPKKQETTVIEEIKGEKVTAIAQIEEWGNWNPPEISSPNENLQTNVGLRRTTQRAERQEIQSQTQQEDKTETHKRFRKNIPGAYHEEDEEEEEIRALIPKNTRKPKKKRKEIMKILR